MKDPDFDIEEPQRSRSPWLVACLGCSVVMILGAVVLCAVGGYFAYLAWGKVDQFASRYEQRGYQRYAGQVMTVDTPVDSPRVYTAQVLKVNSNVAADLAVMAQVLEIYGTVDGDIDFMGQLLVVKPTGVVKGDIRIEAGQVIEVQGVVEGEITGSYQVLKRSNNEQAEQTTVADTADQQE
jgi:hypothetical protein